VSIVQELFFRKLTLEGAVGGITICGESRKIYNLTLYNSTISKSEILCAGVFHRHESYFVLSIGMNRIAQQTGT